MPAGQYIEGQRAIIIADKTIANSSAAASIVGTLSNPSLVNLANRPPSLTGNLVQLGTTFELEIAGVIGTKIATPGTLTIACKIGTSTVVTKTGPTLPTSLSGEAIVVKLLVTVRTTGGSGTVGVSGTCRITNSTTGIPYEFSLGVASPPTVAFNAASLIDVLSTFSVADPTNTVTWNTGTIYIYDSL